MAALEAEEYVNKYIFQPYQKALERIERVRTLRSIKDVIRDFGETCDRAVRGAKRTIYYTTVIDSADKQFTLLCYHATRRACEVIGGEITTIEVKFRERWWYERART